MEKEVTVRKKLKPIKRLKLEQIKPEINRFYLTPKFTGNGYTEGEEEISEMMVYTDGRIAVFAAMGQSLKKSARYILFETIEDFADKFEIKEADKPILRARISAFLKMINQGLKEAA